MLTAAGFFYDGSCMCGRFNLVSSPEIIQEHFKLNRLPHYQPSYNITPARKILCIVALENGSLKAVNLFWGLVPSWAKDSKNSHHLINARSETLCDKPSFRAAFHKRRCLIVAEGFYEWQKLDEGKQAYTIHNINHQLFVFAGIWEHWDSPELTLYSCSIITTAATGFMESIHERMPVIIPEAGYSEWLNKGTEEANALNLLNNQSYVQMTATKISTWVNNPKHDDERCLQ